MIVIDDKIISDDVVKSHFICDLTRCKGACCVQGDGGAPLELDEVGILEDVYEEVEPYLTQEGKEAIAKKGHYVLAEDSEYTEFATPLIEGSEACAYVRYNEVGVAECAIQRAHYDGKIDWIKPVSCHLYPIRITTNKNFEAVNYDRWEICSAACEFGEKEQVPLYQFLKEPLIRKYGDEFFERLDHVAKKMK